VRSPRQWIEDRLVAWDRWSCPPVEPAGGSCDSACRRRAYRAKTRDDGVWSEIRRVPGRLGGRHCSRVDGRPRGRPQLRRPAARSASNQASPWRRPAFPFRGRPRVGAVDPHIGSPAGGRRSAARPCSAKAQTPGLFAATHRVRAGRWAPALLATAERTIASSGYRMYPVELRDRPPAPSRNLLPRSTERGRNLGEASASSGPAALDLRAQRHRQRRPAGDAAPDITTPTDREVAS
jgi:hypothetical protein